MLYQINCYKFKSEGWGNQYSSGQVWWTDLNSNNTVYGWRLLLKYKREKLIDLYKMKIN